MSRITVLQNNRGSPKLFRCHKSPLSPVRIYADWLWASPHVGVPYFQNFLPLLLWIPAEIYRRRTGSLTACVSLLGASIELVVRFVDRMVFAFFGASLVVPPPVSWKSRLFFWGSTFYSICSRAFSNGSRSIVDEISLLVRCSSLRSLLSLCCGKYVIFSAFFSGQHPECQNFSPVLCRLQSAEEAKSVPSPSC